MYLYIYIYIKSIIKLYTSHKQAPNFPSQHSSQHSSLVGLMSQSCAPYQPQAAHCGAGCSCIAKMRTQKGSEWTRGKGPSKVVEKCIKCTASSCFMDKIGIVCAAKRNGPQWEALGPFCRSSISEGNNTSGGCRRWREYQSRGVVMIDLQFPKSCTIRCKDLRISKVLLCRTFLDLTPGESSTGHLILFDQVYAIYETW